MTRQAPTLDRPRMATRRLILRPLRPRHARVVFDAVDESRRALRPWMPWLDATVSSDDTLEFIRRMSRSGTDAVWGIWEPQGTALRFCGNVGLHKVYLSQATGMLGYWTRTSCEGKGYATEASAAVILWAFARLRIERLEIAAATGNAASLKVMRKLGFVREGVMREAQRIPWRRRRLDWVLASLVRGDLRRVRKRLVDLCGARYPWRT